MSIFSSPRFLSRVMWADALSCVGCGALQLVFSQAMNRVTGLPLPLLIESGAFLLVYAAAAAWMASRSVPPRRLIGLVVLGNFAWAAGCLFLLAAGGLSLTGFGVAWLLMQALVVVVLAELQWTGLRQRREPARAATA